MTTLNNLIFILIKALSRAFSFICNLQHASKSPTFEAKYFCANLHQDYIKTIEAISMNHTDDDKKKRAKSFSVSEIIEKIFCIFSIEDVINRSENAPLISKEDYISKLLANESSLVQDQAYIGYLNDRKPKPTTFKVLVGYFGEVTLFEDKIICKNTVSAIADCFTFCKHQKSIKHDIYLFGRYTATVKGSVIQSM